MFNVFRVWRVWKYRCPYTVALAEWIVPYSNLQTKYSEYWELSKNRSGSHNTDLCVTEELPFFILSEVLKQEYK